MKKVIKIVLSIIIIISTSNIVTARYHYIPTKNYPIHILVYDNYLLNSYPSSYYWSGSLRLKNIEKKKLIIKYQFNNKKISYIHDENLPEWIKAFTENSKYIFAGGEGLAVFDKKKERWEKWNKFQEYTINAMAVNENTIWLGTNQGVIEVNLNDKRIINNYSTSSGLNSNRISSLFITKDILLVGTFRKGTGKYPERKADIYGMGLAQINLSDNKVKKVKLPVWQNKYGKSAKYNMVLDMYPLREKENTIKIVLWKPWVAKCWDYNYITKDFVESKKQYHQLDKILHISYKDAYSELAGHLINYIITMGLNNWCGGGFPNRIAKETIRLIYERKDFAILEKLLNDKDYETRRQAVWQIASIEDIRITKYLLKALEDKDPEVVSSASTALGRRKEKKAIKPLKKILETKDRKKAFNALSALIEIDDSIIKKIIVSDDEFLKHLLGSVFSIEGDNKIHYLEKTVMNKNEPILLRRGAILYLNGGYDCRYKIGPEDLLTKFLKDAINDKNEDEVIKKHAKRILDKIKQAK